MKITFITNRFGDIIAKDGFGKIIAEIEKDDPKWKHPYIGYWRYAGYTQGRIVEKGYDCFTLAVIKSIIKNRCKAL